MRPRPFHPQWFIAMGLFVLTIIAFARSGRLDFVNYDDPDYVTKNLVVQGGLSWDGLRWAFSSTQATNWHPVTWLSHMLDCSIFGLDPRGHHGMSVFLHGINAALLFFLLNTMTRALWPSAVVAALFSIHPLRVESVAWIAERKDILSLLFGLLAIMAYVRWIRGAANDTAPLRRHVHYGVTVLCFGLSLMSKPMLVTLPFLLLLLDFWPLQRFGNGKQPGRHAIALVMEKLPLLAMSVASSVITVLAQSRGGAMSNLEAVPLPLRLANAVVTYGIYLRQMAWPAPLAVLYPYRTDLSIALVMACLALVGTITAAAFVFRRTRPYVLVGWLWYLGTLVPVIGLVQVGQQAHADRYTYFPMIGILLAIVWMAASILHDVSRQMRLIAGVVFMAIMLVLSLRTHDQLKHWRDSVTLFEHSIAVAGGTAVSCNNLGSALVDRGRPEEGIVWLERALGLNPEHAPAHSNLGMAYANAGREDLAEGSFLAALRINPANVNANYNLGVLRLKQGRLSEAEAMFKAAIAHRPSYYDARFNLSHVLIRAGRVDEARAMLRELIAEYPQQLPARLTLADLMLDNHQPLEAAREFAEALTIEPHHAPALRGLGTARLRLGQPAQAIVHLRESLAIDPDHAPTHNTLGLALAQRAQFADAEAAFRAAVRVQPAFAEAWNNLGKALQTLHRPDDSLAAFDTALAQQPEFASAHFHRGNLLLSLNRLDEALAGYQRALDQEPDFIDAHYNRGFTLLRLRRWAEAGVAFRATLQLSRNHRGAQRGLAEAIVSQPDATSEQLTEALTLAEALNLDPAQREAATLLVLAAAQSRNDQMANAILTLGLARPLAGRSPELLAEIERCAALYADGKPFSPSPALSKP